MAKKKAANSRKKKTGAKKKTSSLIDTTSVLAERGFFGPTWSAEEKAKLAPHVVNMRAGRFVDSGDYETVFLRPVMSSSKDTTLSAHFVLQPV